jgi:hypothetical protein
MIVEKIDPARESFSDFSLEGTILTIGGIEIDLQAEEGDQEVIITLGSCAGMVHRNLSPTCTYVADIIIPPRRYTTVPVEGSDEEEEDDGGEGAPGGAPKTKTLALAIDTEVVTLRLWPVVDESESEMNKENMEDENVAE